MAPLFLGKAFNTSKCKALLRLTVTRIKLLKNKTQVLTRQTRRDVAELLKSGQIAKASKRAELLCSQENTLAAYELIEHYCDLVVSYLPAINSQKTCPPDLKEAISGLIFAAVRCADLHELQKVRNIFETKYGKEFVVAAVELRRDCGVSKQIIEKLSSHSPAEKVKLKLMKEIAVENMIGWDYQELTEEPVKLDEYLSVEALASAQPDTSLDRIPTIEDARQSKGKAVKHVQIQPLVQRSSEHTRFKSDGMVNHSSVQDMCETDPYAAAKLQGKMDYDPFSTLTKTTETESKDDFLKPGENILSPFKKEFEASSTKDSSMKCLDVVAAAQVAYESAAHAAVAAQAVIDLTKLHASNSTNRMIYASFLSEDNHCNTNNFDNLNAARATRNNINFQHENLLDRTEDCKFEMIKNSPKYKCRSESNGHGDLKPTDEDLVRNNVKYVQKTAQITGNRKELENLNALNTKKVSEVAKVSSRSTNDDNHSQNDQEKNSAWPFTSDVGSQTSSNVTKGGVNIKFGNKIWPAALPMFSEKETSDLDKLYGEIPKKPLDLFTLTGPKFDEDEDGDDDDDEIISSSKKSEEDVDSNHHLEAKESVWHGSQSGRDVETGHGKSNELPEKRASLEGCRQPEMAFVHESEASKIEQTGCRGSISRLKEPEGSAQQKLKWHSRYLEDYDSSLQSDHFPASEPYDTVSSLESIFTLHPHNGIGNCVRHASAIKSDYGLDASSPVKHNPYCVKSRRSVRSVRPNVSHIKCGSEDGGSSYGLSYSTSEQTEESSISEQTEELNDMKLNKASDLKHPLSNPDDDSPSVIDISLRESRKDSVSSASLFSDSSLHPSLSSYSSMSSPNSTFKPKFSPDFLSSQETIIMMPSGLLDSGLPDDELIARFEALRRKH